MKRLDIRSAAIQDVSAATDHYAAEDEKLADRWLDTLRLTLTSTQRRPTLGSATCAEQVGLPGIRHRLVARFPYLVFYIENETGILVVRVLHQRRDVIGELHPGTD